ncbi:MAG: mechanosensitive ion channel family protein [Ignavibacteria bacterium]|nr:mechanosensitive ion channel family protein [Ignavibacteria bacterium]
MCEQRVVFTVGVAHQTPAEKLRRTSALLREIVESQREVRFDCVHFREREDFALVYGVVYYVARPDYNSDIYRCFELEGLDFAYPTQTLFVHGTNSQTETIRTLHAGNRAMS